MKRVKYLNRTLQMKNILQIIIFLLSITIINLNAINLQMLNKEYQGCGDTKRIARENLSNNILVNIHSNITTTKRIAHNNYDKTVISNSNQSSNLELSDVKIVKNKDNKYCAYIKYNVQLKHTKKLETEILNFNMDLLPKNKEEQLNIVNYYLNVITKYRNLNKVFDTKNKNIQKQKIMKIYKQLIDIKSKLLKELKNKVWKVCANTNNKSLTKLNNIIFMKKDTKNEEKGFLGFFTSNEKEKSLDELPLYILENFIHSSQKDANYCNYIEKNELLQKLNDMYNKLKSYNSNNLPINPKDQIKVIDDWLNNITNLKKLIHLYADNFKASNKIYIQSIENNLKLLLKDINPQYVIFKYRDKNITILIDNKTMLHVDQKLYIKIGEHEYIVKKSGKCPLVGRFTINKNDDKEIDISFENSNYPTIIFDSNKKNAQLSINGKKYKVGLKYTIPICNKSVHYQISYENQISRGDINFKTNKNIRKEFDFLTKEEIKIFNSVKPIKVKINKNEQISIKLSNTDIRNSLLKFKIEDNPLNGKIDLDDRGIVVYTPNKNFRGSDKFSYTVKTSEDKSPKKIVEISVVGKNNLPKIEVMNKINLKQGTSYSGKAKATDKDEDKLIFTLIKSSDNANVEIDKDGSFKYIPNKLFYGKDSFSYQVEDNYGGKAIGIININVTRANNKPRAKGKSVSLKINASKEFKLIYNDEDGDNLKFILIKDVEHGSLECNKLKICTYKPLKDFSGKDEFTYKVADGISNSNVATVSLSIETKKQDKNNTPISKDIKLKVSSGIIKEFKLIGEDKDGDILTFKIVDTVKNGSLKCTLDGICKYKSLEEYNGEDSFSYIAIDIKGFKSKISDVLFTVKSPSKIIAKKEINKKYQELKAYLDFLFNALKNGEQGAESAIYKIKNKNPKLFNKYISEKIN